MDEFLPVRVSAFDEMTGTGGIERGSAILIAGGCGTGKTLFCIQSLYNGALNGEKGIYISFEEDVDKLKKRVKRSFGWDFDKLEKEGKIMMINVDPFKVARAVEAEIMKKEEELLIEVPGVDDVIPEDFHPDKIVIDSLSAISLSFLENRENYRIYVKKLLSSLVKYNAVVYVIGETEQEPEKYSRTGIEEFLVDGVIVLYNVRRNELRIRAMEILKLRGANHIKKMVPYEITSNGIEIYPEEKVYI